LRLFGHGFEGTGIDDVEKDVQARSGGIVPGASAPAVGAARSPTPTMASELAVN